MPTAPADTKTAPADDAEARRREERLYADLEDSEDCIDLPPDQRYKKVMAMSTDEQLAFADSLRGGRARNFSTAWIPSRKKLCWP